MTFTFGNVPVRCPRTQAPLVRDGQRLISTDESTRLAYSIVNDIPCLIVEQATQLPVDEWKRAMAGHDFND